MHVLPPFLWNELAVQTSGDLTLHWHVPAHVPLQVLLLLRGHGLLSLLVPSALNLKRFRVVKVVPIAMSSGSLLRGHVGLLESDAKIQDECVESVRLALGGLFE